MNFSVGFDFFFSYKNFPSWSPTPFDFKTVWFIFCTDLALFWGDIFSSKQLLASSIQQVQLEQKALFMQAVPLPTEHFMPLTTAFNCAVLSFFLIQAETLVYHFLCKGFLFHVCEYSTRSLELVSKVILGSLTNVPALLPIFIYALLLLMTVTAQQLLLVVFKVLLLSLKKKKQNCTCAERCNILASH